MVVEGRGGDGGEAGRGGREGGFRQGKTNDHGGGIERIE